MAGCFGKEELTPGVLEGNLYRNDFFNLSFELPEGWTILTEAEVTEVGNLSVEFISELNEELAKQIEEDEDVVDLVHALKHPLNYRVSFNPNFVCNAENVKDAGTTFHNGKDYLEYSKDLFQKAGLPWQFEHIHLEVLDDVNFYTMNARIDIGNGFIRNFTPLSKTVMQST
ncbi:MAG: hypothetical protein FH749_13195 [Firmicutes bacterium]|nr:hypothetical protein [Bacillota bacterium]